jgi:hypothetical protein
MTNTDTLICIRCNRPVEINKKNYETYEKMHWICFHLEYEHDTDPDKACSDPGCPWRQLENCKNKLLEIGIEPKNILFD